MKYRYGPDTAALLDGLPRFASGDYLFGVTGKAPYRGFAKGKERLDQLSGVTEWRLHDIRRTARTRWSAIAEVPDMVKELAMAHAQPGLHRTYDLHSYRDEKRHLLKLWEAKLRNIIDPPPANVVPMQRLAGVGGLSHD